MIDALSEFLIDIVNELEGLWKLLKVEKTVDNSLEQIWFVSSRMIDQIWANFNRYSCFQ